MREKWTEGVSLFINAEPADGIDYYDIWHNGGPGGPMLVAHHENSARAICDAIEELHELRAEVERLRAQVDDYRMMIDGLENAAHEERAAVVAYLNVRAETLDHDGNACCGHVEDLASDIERGLHRREEKT